MMKRSIAYWATTALVGAATFVRRLQLFDGRSRGARELPARGISPAAACLARHWEAGGSLSAAPAAAAGLEGGLRRLH
jgi:hypothetical protein